MITRNRIPRTFEMLNKQQSEICSHIIQHLDTSEKQMCLFLEGGAGVGKTQCAQAIHQSVITYCATAGEDPNDIRTLKLAPTGMAPYHIGRKHYSQCPKYK